MSGAVTLRCQCGRLMVERENRQTGRRFMGCTGYPEFCTATAKVPAYLELRRAGAAELPGMEDL